MILSIKRGLFLIQSLPFYSSLDLLIHGRIQSRCLTYVHRHSAEQGLTKLIKGGYKEGNTASPEAVEQLLTQYSKTQGNLHT